jgi:hypothetical protein
MKGAMAVAILRNASSTLFPSESFAGSVRGPMITKSLYITSKRLTPKPCAMNLSSAGLSWTNTTSASPRRPISSACPVPTATTFTWMPVRAEKRGRMKLNSPDCSVDVVEATTIECSCAKVALWIINPKIATSVNSRCFMSDTLVSCASLVTSYAPPSLKAVWARLARPVLSLFRLVASVQPSELPASISSARRRSALIAMAQCQRR